MRVGVRFSIDNIIWCVKWFDNEDINVVFDNIGTFIDNTRTSYGQVWVKTKFIYEEER